MRGCNYKSGPLPDCAPLAVALVPAQQSDTPQYGAEEALNRGTLFPGLDLPFKNMVNTGNPMQGTPLGELMTLGFVVDEMRLYLDTHPEDQEAFEALKDMVLLAKEARKRYAAQYGPVSFDDVVLSETYDWIDAPWPWNYPCKEGV